MGEQMKIRLAWPKSALSGNSRCHWSAKARATNAARREAWAAAAQAGWPRLSIKRPMLRFSYLPPDLRRRDAQNVPQMLKPSIDGIADALGVDDRNFLCVFPSRFGEVTSGGAIIIEISETEGRGQ